MASSESFSNIFEKVDKIIKEELLDGEEVREIKMSKRKIKMPYRQGEDSQCPDSTTAAAAAADCDENVSKTASGLSNSSGQPASEQDISVLAVSKSPSATEQAKSPSSAAGGQASERDMSTERGVSVSKSTSTERGWKSTTIEEEEDPADIVATKLDTRMIPHLDWATIHQPGFIEGYHAIPKNMELGMCLESADPEQHVIMDLTKIGHECAHVYHRVFAFGIAPLLVRLLENYRKRTATKFTKVPENPDEGFFALLAGVMQSQLSQITPPRTPQVISNVMTIPKFCCQPSATACVKM